MGVGTEKAIEIGTEKAMGVGTEKAIEIGTDGGVGGGLKGARITGRAKTKETATVKDQVQSPEAEELRVVSSSEKQAVRPGLGFWR